MVMGCFIATSCSDDADQLDADRETVVFKTKDGSKVVNKDYHHGKSFVYGKRHDLEGYFFIIEESDLQ